MDKVLAFSILSASPADLAAGSGGYCARLSWRRRPDERAAGRGQTADRQRGEGSSQSQSQQKEERRPRGDAAAMPPRFAPEFDGIDCFETIVLH